MTNETVTPSGLGRSVDDDGNDLIPMLAHDMRSPLTSLLGFLDLLRASSTPRLLPRELACLKSAIHSAKSLVEMIAAMLDVNRFERDQISLSPRTCDLVVLVRESLDWLGASSMLCSIRLNADDSVQAWADEEVTRRVLVNLLMNALKFTPEEGCVVIEVTNRTAGAHVAFTDEGPTIPETHRQKIFDRNGQIECRKESVRYASGLGLAFCKLAIEAQKGCVGVECSALRGATFWFCLPRSST